MKSGTVHHQSAETVASAAASAHEAGLRAELAASQAENERLRAELADTRAELAATKAELEQFQITATNGKKSGKVMPFARRKRVAQLKNSGRRTGEGPFTFRHAPTPTEPEIIVAAPTVCPDCGGELQADGEEIATLTQPPKPEPQVVPTRVPLCRCSACGKRVRGRHADLADKQHGRACPSPASGDREKDLAMQSELARRGHLRVPRQPRVNHRPPVRRHRHRPRRPASLPAPPARKSHPLTAYRESRQASRYAKWERPMPGNEHLIARLAGIQKILMGAHEGSRKSSNASKGRECELFVDAFLSQVMPMPFRFGSGEITDSQGNITGQLDIVVEYPFLPSVPLSVVGPRLYVAEGVAAVLEVKSNLDGQWGDVLKSAEKVRALRRTWPLETMRIRQNSIRKWHVSDDELPDPEIPFFAVGFEGIGREDHWKRKLASGLVDGVLVIDAELFVSTRRFDALKFRGPGALWGLVCSVHKVATEVAHLWLNPSKYAGQDGRVTRWIDRLYDRRPQERKCAIHELGHMHGEAAEAVPHLAKVFREHPEHRPDIARILGKIGANTEESLPCLLDALNGDGQELRRQAIFALRAFAAASGIEAAMPKLREYASSADQATALEALVTLAKCGAEGCEAVEIGERLRADAPIDVVSRIAGAYGLLAERGEPALEPLIAMLRDTDRNILRNALNSLGEIGAHFPKKVLRNLIPLTKHADGKVRHSAVRAIGKLGTRYRPAVAALLEIVRIADDDWRFGQAFTELESLGIATAEVLAAFEAVQKADIFGCGERATEIIRRLKTSTKRKSKPRRRKTAKRRQPTRK